MLKWTDIPPTPFTKAWLRENWFRRPRRDNLEAIDRAKFQRLQKRMTDLAWAAYELEQEIREAPKTTTMPSGIANNPPKEAEVFYNELQALLDKHNVHIGSYDQVVIHFGTSIPHENPWKQCTLNELSWGVDPYP